VVDLFSPHDGSIDLRVLSECFLESDFVENEVSKKKTSSASPCTILYTAVLQQLLKKGDLENASFQLFEGSLVGNGVTPCTNSQQSCPGTSSRLRRAKIKNHLLAARPLPAKKIHHPVLSGSAFAPALPRPFQQKKRIKDTRLATYIHILYACVCVCVCVYTYIHLHIYIYIYIYIT
jgi:hypothetical protein